MSIGHTLSQQYLLPFGSCIGGAAYISEPYEHKAFSFLGPAAMIGLGILAAYNENRIVKAIGAAVTILGIAELAGILPQNFALVQAIALGILGIGAFWDAGFRVHNTGYRIEGMEQPIRPEFGG